MHHPTDRLAHTTTFVTPVVVHWLEREIAQWVQPMKDRSDDPSHHERTLLPRKDWIKNNSFITSYSDDRQMTMTTNTQPADRHGYVTPLGHIAQILNKLCMKYFIDKSGYAQVARTQTDVNICNVFY